MKTILILGKLLLLLPLFVSAQVDKKQKLAKIDTRVMYDMRGQGITATYDFVILNSGKHPVIISVATDDKKFIEAVKQIIREMDWEGYENIVLLLNDEREGAKTDGETHRIDFYKNGNFIAAISKLNGNWGFIMVDKQNSISAIMLAKGENDYPKSIIRTKIRTTHDGSGADNFVSGLQN